MAFTPFMQSTKAQNIIDQYLNTTTPQPDINSAGNFRNPFFDLRTEQGLSDDALYPNPQMDFSVQEDEIVDPCQEGFMLVDGVCQPIETFGQSLYQEDNDNKDSEPREYYSIEDMKEMGDYDFLAELGYNFTNNKQGEPVYNLTTPMGIINNAQSANSLLTGNQQFTDPEISYQVQAKMDNVRESENNPNYTYTKPQMTEQQVIDDAIKSGATSVNPFERFGINQSTPTQSQNNTPKNVGNPFGYNNNSKPPFLS